MCQQETRKLFLSTSTHKAIRIEILFFFKLITAQWDNNITKNTKSSPRNILHIRESIIYFLFLKIYFLTTLEFCLPWILKAKLEDVIRRLRVFVKRFHQTNSPICISEYNFLRFVIYIFNNFHISVYVLRSVFFFAIEYILNALNKYYKSIDFTLLDQQPKCI